MSENIKCVRCKHELKEVDKKPDGSYKKYCATCLLYMRVKKLEIQVQVLSNNIPPNKSYCSCCRFIKLDEHFPAKWEEGKKALCLSCLKRNRKFHVERSIINQQTIYNNIPEMKIASENLIANEIENFNIKCASSSCQVILNSSNSQKWKNNRLKKCCIKCLNKQRKYQHTKDERRKTQILR